MMLESLHVHNFALIEDAEVEFSRGFNVFTGETGAGKSILIDAFGIVLGGRASADFVRSGTDGFWVQAVFGGVDHAEVEDFLRQHDLETEEQLFLKRSVNAQGKSKASINGVQVPLTVLRELGALLVNIHGQHENQQLLKADAPRLLTDEFAGSALQKILSGYAKAYEEYKSALKNLQGLQNANQDRDRLLELAEHTAEEIDSAHLKIGEEEELNKEGAILQHGEKIMGAVTCAHEGLSGENGVLSLLAEVRERVREVQRYDEGLKNIYNSLDEAWITLDDAGSELGDYLQNCDFNEERANYVQNRLDLLYRLEKKYGGTLEKVLERGREAREQAERLLDIESVIEKANLRLQKAEKQVAAAAGELTGLRQEWAAVLTAKITEHLRDLAMPEGKLAIAFADTGDFTASGRDAMTFLFSANRGEPLCELGKVASGGELSRLALAVKTVLLSTHDAGTMVFDEIDAGVGGVTAERMGEKIGILSRHNQVLCITHLPQMAAFGDRHIFIAKQAHGERTSTTLTVLSEEDRVEELVRMAAGSNRTASAVQAAEELLINAEKFKESLQA